MQLQRAGVTVWAHALQAVVVVMAGVLVMGVVVAQGEVVVAGQKRVTPAMRKARRLMCEDRQGRRRRRLHMAASANHHIHALLTVMLSMVIANMTIMMMAVMADL